jgi:HlyD family secretion protein
MLNVILKVLVLGSILNLLACTAHESGVALGTVERERITLSAPASEVIENIQVHAGELLQPGQVILTLNQERQRSKVAQRNAEVAVAQAMYDELKNGARAEDVASAKSKVDAAQASLDEANNTYQRYQTLLKDGMAGQSQFDSAHAQQQVAQANLRDAQEKLQLLLKGSRAEQILKALAQLQAAQAQLRIEQQNLRELSITSSVNALVDDIPWHVGERVTAGSVVAVLMADHVPYVRVYIPQLYRAKLAIGDALNVRVDGITTLFSGTLRRIQTQPAFTPYYALNQNERARLVYLAEIQLPASASQLPTGLTAQVILP